MEGEASPTLTIRAAVNLVRRRIPRLDARLLVQHLLGIGHAEYLAYPERPLDAEQERAFFELVKRRERGEPLAYITGEREFFGRSFAVTQDVLIPRPDTELLVLLALERMLAFDEPRVLDLGAGSGAIAVTLAAERPRAGVCAGDISAAALAVAERNAARHRARVRWLLGDWYGPVAGERFDLIVANPPYVAAQDPHLAQDGLPFEPDIALTDGADGLSCLRTIIAGAPAHLVPGGWLLCEHGYDQAATCRELFAASGFKHVGSWRDLAAIERVTGGQWLPDHPPRPGDPPETLCETEPVQEPPA